MVLFGMKKQCLSKRHICYLTISLSYCLQFHEYIISTECLKKNPIPRKEDTLQLDKGGGLSEAPDHQRTRPLRPAISSGNGIKVVSEKGGGCTREWSPSFPCSRQCEVSTFLS